MPMATRKTTHRVKGVSNLYLVVSQLHGEGNLKDGEMGMANGSKVGHLVLLPPEPALFRSQALRGTARLPDFPEDSCKVPRL